MALSNDLLYQFAKISKPETETNKETTVYGTFVRRDGTPYVKMDGSDILTPVYSTANATDGDRVTVLIKNHSAVITGNLSDPSATTGEVGEIGNKITEFEIVIADKVDTIELNAQIARIDELTSQNVTITGELTAAQASIETLEAKNVTITGDLTAAQADIDHLTTSKLDASVAEITYATITNLEATNADIRNLTADYGEFQSLVTNKFVANDAAIEDLVANRVTIEELEANYANIDFANITQAAIENFFSKSGMIGDLIVGEGTVTGTLVGVKIHGDLIEGGTIVADKLVVKGTDGLYYRLNTDGETVSSEQTEYNSLNGKVIIAQSITAEKIAVSDLSAFRATIGGFNVTDSSIYSGVKNSVNNATRGLYMDDSGQISIGDSNEYVKFYEKSEGIWKLEIESDEFVQTVKSNIDFGGRNLIRNSNNLIYDDYHFSGETNVLQPSNATSPYDKEEECATFNVEAIEDSFLLSNIMTIGEKYVFTFWIKSDADGSVTVENKTISTTSKWNKQILIFTAETVDLAIKFNTAGTYYVYHPKLELGNIPSDWSPNPSDLEEELGETQATANDAKNAADSVEERLSVSESTIKQLSDSIAMLVTDENGSSMMTQTSQGWTFNVGSINAALNNAVNGLNDLAGDVNEANSAITNLEALANDLSQKTAYIIMTTDELGDPCIELGKADNPFKLRITNTSVDFIEGSSKIAYITNRALYIETAIIKNELQIGEGTGFIFKRRSNGNMGLRWIGG